jgi:hypothetical protein
MGEIEVFVLAESAKVADGKLYILGGGLTIFLTDQFPVAAPPLEIGGMLRVNWNDSGKPMLMGVDVVDQDERSILPAMMPVIQHPMVVNRNPRSGEGSDQTAPFALTIGGLVFPKQGSYAVVGTLEGVERARSKFEVMSASRS